MSAVMLLSLALAPVMTLFPSGARQAAFSEAHVAAHARAEQALDEWVEQATAGKFIELSDDATETAPQDPLRVTVSGVEVEGKPGLWRATATAEWTSAAGEAIKPGTLVLERLFSRPTLSFEFDSEPQTTEPVATTPEETHS